MLGPGGRSNSSSSVRTITPNTMKNMTKIKKLIFARSLARDVTARGRPFIVSAGLSHGPGTSGLERFCLATDSVEPGAPCRRAPLQPPINTTRRLHTMTVATLKTLASADGRTRRLTLSRGVARSARPPELSSHKHHFISENNYF